LTTTFTSLLVIDGPFWVGGRARVFCLDLFPLLFLARDLQPRVWCLVLEYNE
jgi:hypothetical protein